MTCAEWRSRSRANEPFLPFDPSQPALLLAPSPRANRVSGDPLDRKCFAMQVVEHEPDALWCIAMRRRRIDCERWPATSNEVVAIARRVILRRWTLAHFRFPSRRLVLSGLRNGKKASLINFLNYEVFFVSSARSYFAN